MELAPIVLFTYSRPQHTQDILDSLTQNKESKDSVIYIYCDGPKEHCSVETIEKIKAVRSICQNENRFRKVNVIVQPENKGLANSIINGVTEVVNNHGSAIVLEDDLILSPYFLYYMNDSLNRYEHNKEVGQIGACNFFACGNKFPDNFFIPIPDCLGWATWKNRWEKFNPDSAELLDLLNSQPEKLNTFNAYGSYDFISMLKMQKENKVSSWAIRWQAVCVLNGWKALYPNLAMSNHVESNNADATHANINILPPLQLAEPALKTIECKEIPSVIEAMKLGYSGRGDYFGNKKKVSLQEIKGKLKSKVKANIIKFTPPVMLEFIKKKFRGQTGSLAMWSGKYSSWHDANKFCSGYDDNSILEKVKSATAKVRKGEYAYERDSFLFNELQHNWPLIKLLENIAVKNGNTLRIIDFGGSLGSTYNYIKAVLPKEIVIKWYVVEQPHFVDCGREHFATNEIDFCLKIEDVTPGPNDVLLLSSVLQYLEKPYDMVQAFQQRGFEHIIFDRTSVILKEEERWTIQNVPESIYKASYPCYFFNTEKLADAFTDYNATDFFESSYDQPQIVDGNECKWIGFLLTRKAGNDKP